MFGRDEPKYLVKQTARFDDPSRLLFVALVLSLENKPTATETCIKTNKCAGGISEIALITLKN